jgi:hypothetical protein
MSAVASKVVSFIYNSEEISLRSDKCPNLLMKIAFVACRA